MSVLEPFKRKMDAYSFGEKYSTLAVNLPQNGLLQRIIFDDTFWGLPDTAKIMLTFQYQMVIFQMSIKAMRLLATVYHSRRPFIPVAEEINGEEIGLLPFQHPEYSAQLQLTNYTSLKENVNIQPIIWGYHMPREQRDFPNFDFINSWQEMLIEPYRNIYNFPIGYGILRKIITYGWKEPRIYYGNHIKLRCFRKELYPNENEPTFFDLVRDTDDSKDILNAGLNTAVVSGVCVEGYPFYDKSDNPIRLIINRLIPVRVS